MTKIVRTATRAEGGITNAERDALRAHADLWISRALRTTPVDHGEITAAVAALYAVAGLKAPRVVVVPSPIVMAASYGASAAIWHVRKTTTVTADDATRDATNATFAATHAATFAATHAATFDATDDATEAATHANTRDATDDATYATFAATFDATDDATEAMRACCEIAGDLGLAYAARWSDAYQGGAYLAGYDCYLTAMRDIIGLRLPCHTNYAAWERAAIAAPFRVLHPEFCIVSDFPEILAMDDSHRPHCETGPSHRWRDGWALYHWHGVRVPDAWILNRATLTAQDVFSQTNAEVRRAGCEILGWDRVFSGIDAKLIDDDGDPQIGVLYAGQIPGAEPCGFLKVQCGTGREFIIPVPSRLTSAVAAQAWVQGVEPSKWIKPEVRG